MPPEFIPRTDIERLYRDVCKRPGGPQTRLDWAAQTDVVDQVARAFATSLEQLAPYDNDEGFRHPETTALTAARTDDLRSTISVALRLRDERRRLEPAEGDGPSYRYVEREFLPQRTTGGARFNDPRQELADGGAASSAMRVDLLLEADDGAPAVGEIKIGRDRDPICALVQVLAGACLLATPSQRERLDLHHGLRTDGCLDAVILLIDFPDDPLMQRARDRAEELAKALIADPRVGGHVRRIIAFEATADPTAGDPLTARIAFLAKGACGA